MQLINHIPETFWSLFRSGNRLLYIESLVNLNDEYQYNNYFLSWEVCVQILSNFLAEQRIQLKEEEIESELERIQPPATRILCWLVKTGWLEKVEDYNRGITNVIIPDYAEVFIQSFEKVCKPQEEEAEVYIRNVYASIFSYMNDLRGDISFLKGALQNTKILNKSLQSLLHNMNRFFSNLLEQEQYGDLLTQHLSNYVDEIVKKKYHILKTSDNFYLYKNDIKQWLKQIEEHTVKKALEIDEREENKKIIQKYQMELELVQQINRGFDDIEQRISYMDEEHTKYIRATVTRLNYLINEDKDTKGLLIRFLNTVSNENDLNASFLLEKAAERLNLTEITVLSKQRFYRRRKTREEFSAGRIEEVMIEDLTKEEVLQMNKTHNKYNKKQIEQFIRTNMKQDEFEVTAATIKEDSEFEQLVLAYDYAIKQNSIFEVIEEGEQIDTGVYCYPKLTFKKKKSED